MAGIDAQLDVELDGLVKLGLCGVNDSLERLGRIVLLGAVDLLGAVYILFTLAHYKYPPLVVNAGNRLAA